MSETDKKEILVWGEGPKDLWSFGETIDIPDGFEFMPAGDAAKTRFVKANSDVLYIHMQRVKQGNRKIGVWAPAEIILQAQSVTLKTTPEERALQREKKQNSDFKKAREEIRRQFPSIPEEDIEAVVQRAFTVGHGTVGRTAMKSLEDRCFLAVQAHARHNHTGYDVICISFGDRDRARSQVAKKVGRILDQWREPVSETS